jgi:hypothetical protein
VEGNALDAGLGFSEGGEGEEGRGGGGGHDLIVAWRTGVCPGRG